MQPPDVFQNVKTVQQRKPNLNFIRVIKHWSFNQSFVQPYLIELLQTILLVLSSECLLVLLSPKQLYKVLALRSLDIKYFSFANVSITCERDQSHIEFSHSLCKKDAKFQTHTPSTLQFKMPNLRKMDVYNFTYKMSVGILMKPFFL